MGQLKIRFSEQIDTPAETPYVTSRILMQKEHSGDFGNAAKMVGKMSKSVMQLISRCPKMTMAF